MCAERLPGEQKEFFRGPRLGQFEFGGLGSRVPWPVEHELTHAAALYFSLIFSDVQRREYVR
jgi:hypothetical protein